tara:strand:- start:8578 stop:8904 length:327 start_codon:yes stop_codon:yes gene_type:complete
MTGLDSLEWLQAQSPRIVNVEVGGHVFHLRQPTVADRDRFDSMVSKMDMGLARLRSPLLQGLVCDEDGKRIAEGVDFDDMPAELVEPLVDAARELYGITDPPTEGETG